MKDIAITVKAHFELFLYQCWLMPKKNGPTYPTLQPLAPPERLFSPNHLVSRGKTSWQKKVEDRWTKYAIGNIGVEHSVSLHSAMELMMISIIHEWLR